MVPGISRYGEKNALTGAQSWEDLPAQSVMEGVLLPQPPGKDCRLLKVITQDAGPVRTGALGNDRTPIFHPPPGESGAVMSEESARPAKKPVPEFESVEQGELF